MAQTLPDIIGIEMPFANNGSRSNIPAQQTTPGNGLASLSTGFPVETSLPLESGGIPPGRADTNAALYLATLPLFLLQQGGYYTFSEDVSAKIGGYPQGAILYYTDNSTDPAKHKFLMSAKPDNTDNFVTTPSFIGTSWIDVTPYADGFVRLAGDTMTGNLTFSGANTGIVFPNGGKIRNSGSPAANLSIFLQDGNFDDVITLTDGYIQMTTGGKIFKLTADGAATWNGKQVITLTDSYRNGFNFYNVFSNGLIVQGGRISNGADSAVLTISLHKDFTNMNYFPIFTDDGVNSTQITTFKFLPAESTVSAMKVRLSTSATGDTIRWLAIGF